MVLCSGETGWTSYLHFNHNYNINKALGNMRWCKCSWNDKQKESWVSLLYEQDLNTFKCMYLKNQNWSLGPVLSQDSGDWSSEWGWGSGVRGDNQLGWIASTSVAFIHITLHSWLTFNQASNHLNNHFPYSSINLYTMLSCETPLRSIIAEQQIVVMLHL